MNSAQPHCIVIGAGIVGASCAWHLRRRGAEVTVIDSVLPGQSTSYGNAGCISVSSIAPFSHPGAIRKVPGWLTDPLGPMRLRWSHLPRVAPWLWKFWRAGTAARVDEIATAQSSLMKTVLADYDHILQETGAEHLRQSKGLIQLYGNEEELAADAWHFEIRDRFGYPWQRLTRDELKRMEPAVELGRDGIAVYDPVWQHLLSPADVARKIAEKAFADGAHWQNEQVLQVEADDAGVRVNTSGGQCIGGDYLVMATGVWTNTLLKQLGHYIPITAKRGYHSMLEEPSLEISHPLMQVKEYVVITPMRDGLRVAGTAEFAGIDAPPDYRRADALLQHTQRFLPGLSGKRVNRWMGQRPMMPDSMPVLGAIPGKRRVLCAFGHGHYGLTQGPTTGRITADLVFGQEPHVDLTPFSITRFS